VDYVPDILFAEKKVYMSRFWHAFVDVSSISNDFATAQLVPVFKILVPTNDDPFNLCT
jgi:hypothetical protein